MNGEDEGGRLVMLGNAEEDGGYISPEFDLPSESDEESSPPAGGKNNRLPQSKKRKVDVHDAMDEDEELALRLLRRRS